MWFRKPQQRAEEMTDAQMGDRLGVLTNKIKWMNRLFPPAIAFAAVGAVLVGSALAATFIAQAAVLFGIGFAAAVVTTAALSRRDNWQQDIRDLAAENTNRVERGGLALALFDHDNAHVAPSALELKGAFNKVLAEMRRENDTARPSLRLKRAGTSYDLDF
jgi:hypothetical protein